jgi:hypothetical protein
MKKCSQEEGKTKMENNLKRINVCWIVAITVALFLIISLSWFRSVWPLLVYSMAIYAYLKQAKYTHRKYYHFLALNFGVIGGLIFLATLKIFVPTDPDQKGLIMPLLNMNLGNIVAYALAIIMGYILAEAYSPINEEGNGDDSGTNRQNCSRE